MIDSDKIKHVFFDLDHTLWDFEKNSELTFQKIFAYFSLPKVDAFINQYRPINFQLWREFRYGRISQKELRYQRLKQTFDLISLPVDDESIDEISKMYIENLSSFTHLIEGTFDILHYLKPKYQLHIITNGFGEVQNKKIKNSGLKPFFDVVVHSEMAGVKKPNPIIFELALGAAKATRSDAIMIGDSLEADIQGALNIGMQAIHFLEEGEMHKVSPIVRHLSEIKKHL